MKKKLLCLIFLVFAGISYAQSDGAKFSLPSMGSSPVRSKQAIGIGGLFYETAAGRVQLPAEMIAKARSGKFVSTAKMPDGRTVTLVSAPVASGFNISLTSSKTDDIKKWGITVDAAADEYFTGLMERVVDGPQQASWAPGIPQGMNLRGQKVDMIIKPTTSIYAPFYLSSRGYGVFVKGMWPGWFDFAAGDPTKVKIEFEGPKFEFKVYSSGDPAAIVKAHSSDVGHPILPPKWMFTPWRWRDEHTSADDVL